MHRHPDDRAGAAAHGLREFGGRFFGVAAAAITLLLLAMVVVAGCSSSGSGTTTTAAGSGPADLTVRMVGIALDPQTLTVQVGDTVTWTNEDSVSHNVTAKDGSWATDTFGKGGSGSHTFDTPGTYPYVCTVHAGMTGTIIVE